MYMLQLKPFLSTTGVYMTNPKDKKVRVSKAEWLEKALDILEEDGLEEVKIDRLAKELKIARSGFYWHFQNRQSLHRAMLEYWEEEFTAVITTNSDLLRSLLLSRRHKPLTRDVVRLLRFCLNLLWMLKSRLLKSILAILLKISILGMERSLTWSQKMVWTLFGLTCPYQPCLAIQRIYALSVREEPRFRWSFLITVNDSKQSALGSRR